MFVRRIAALGLLLGCVVSMGCSSSPEAEPEQEQEEQAGPEGTSDKADKVGPSETGPTSGYRLPAEFEPVEELLLISPSFNTSVEKAFLDIVKSAQPHVKITIVASDEKDATETMSKIVAKKIPTDNIGTTVLAYNGTWIRDYGPQVVQAADGTRTVIDLEYLPLDPARRQDDSIPSQFGADRGLPVVQAALQLEGGNLLTDGQGRCVTSELTILINAKKHDYTEEQVRKLLSDLFGCTDTTIVPVAGGWEQTGHADMFMVIPAPGKAIVGEVVGEPTTDDRRTNKENLDEAARRLTAAGFEVTRIPMPKASGLGFRTYTNGLILNDGLLVPVYADDKEHESAALDVFKAAFTGHKVHRIDVGSYLRLDGAIHCVSMTVAR